MHLCATELQFLTVFRKKLHTICVVKFFSWAMFISSPTRLRDSGLSLGRLEGKTKTDAVDPHRNSCPSSAVLHALLRSRPSTGTIGGVDPMQLCISLDFPRLLCAVPPVCFEREVHQQSVSGGKSRPAQKVRLGA